MAEKTTPPVPEKLAALPPMKTMEDAPIFTRIIWLLVAATVGLVIALLPTPEGLSPEGHLYLALLAALLIMFLTEPIPLPAVMVCSGLGLVFLGIGCSREVFPLYGHRVVFFILGCLMLAVIAEKVGLTDRLGKALLRMAGTNVIRFSFVMCMGLGIASSIMHDIAATAIGLMAMLPLMRAAGIAPGSRTGIFLTLSLPFCCSAGGMGTMVGGGRCMVAAAFLEDISTTMYHDGLSPAIYSIGFGEWILYAMPGALLAIPLVWFALYLGLRPDKTLNFPELTEEQKTKKPFSSHEIMALIVIGLVFVGFFTRTLHGVHFSLWVMSAVAICMLLGLMRWKELHAKTDWAVCFLVFGGGIALGTFMGRSGAAEWLAGLFFPFFEGQGILVLAIAVGFFVSLTTNLMANVAAAALLMPIAVPIAIMGGMDPTPIALALGMWASFAYLLIIGCPPNVVAYSFGYFRPLDLTKAGFFGMPAGYVAMLLTMIVWWKIIGLV